jgi:hypothetical protein
MEQNLPVETTYVQPFQTNRSFRKSSGWAVEICLFHLLSVWNHRNFHVNGKQPCSHLTIHTAIWWLSKKQYTRDDEPTIFCVNQDKSIDNEVYYVCIEFRS